MRHPLPATRSTAVSGWIAALVATILYGASGCTTAGAALPSTFEPPVLEVVERLKADAASGTPLPLAVNAWKGAEHQLERLSARGPSAGTRFKLLRRGQGDAQLFCTYPLEPGRRYRLTHTLQAAQPVQVDVLMRQEGKPYLSLYRHRIMLGTEPRSFSVEAVYTGPGPGQWRWTVPEGADITVRAIRVEEIRQPLLAVTTPQALPPLFFGLHMRALGQHFNWPELGHTLVRLWDTGTNWRDLQPRPGPIDWAGPRGKRLDLYVDHARRHGAHLLLTLGQTPQWATTGTRSGAYGKGATSAPDRLEDWRAYVRALAQRYKGRVRYWEMWNETDYNGFYTGSVAQMLDLTRVAREELKAADPDNVLLAPNVTSGGLVWLDDFLQQGGGALVDALSIHFYYQHRPQDMLGTLSNLKALMARHGVDKPVWNTEGGPYWMKADPRLLHSLNARAQLLMWAAGLHSFAYYTMEGMTPESGLVEADFRTVSLPGQAYAYMARRLQGAVLEAALQTPEDVYLFRIRTATGREFIAMWAEQAQEVKLPAAWLQPQSRLYEWGGELRHVPPAGAFTLDSTPLLLSVDGKPI